MGMQSLADVQSEIDAAGDCDPSQCDDQDLLGLYERSQDSRYLAEIVSRYHPLVVSVVRRNVNHAHDIQDGVQATFLILVKSIAKIRRRTSLAAWLHGVAYRTARRIRDRSQRERLMQTTDSLDVNVTAHADESPLATVTKKMQLDVLDEELQLLRESYRSVLIEHYLLGKTAAEIAAKCNLSQSTVEGRLRRGRQQLRLQMLRRGFGFSAAVAVSSQFLGAEQAAAGDLTTLVEQVIAYSDPQVTDVPGTISNLIAEETSMASYISTKLSLVILMGSMTTAALGMLAVTAVGEQTGRAQTTNLTAESTSTEPVATVIAPGSAQAAGVAMQNNGNKGQSQAWPSPVTDRVHQTLNLVVQDIAFNAMPLQQVMAGLADDFQIPIQIDVEGLKMEGMDVDVPITLNLPPIPFSQMLDYILSPLELSYRVEGDVLFVSSRRELDRRPSLRVYDYGVFETPGIATVIEQQIRKIQPDHWGTELWSIDQLQEELLFVSASDPAHAEIERLLVDLARQLGKPLPQLVAKQSESPKPKKKTPPTSPVQNPFGDNPFNSSSDPFAN